MAVSKAQQKAVAKYTAANYDELKVRIPKGRRADVDAYAKEHGCSVNSLVNDLLRDTLCMTESEWKEKAKG